MPLTPQKFRKVELIHRVGLASARPAVGDVLVGTLYFSTDSGVLERSNGTTWSAYATTGMTTLPAHHTTHETGGSDVVDYAWTYIPFNAANFVVENGTMVWTVAAGNQSVFSYIRIGHLVMFNVTILGSSLTGPNDTSVLRISIPFTAVDAGSISSCMLEVGADRGSGVAQFSGSRFRIYKNFTAPNFTAGSVNVSFQIAIAV